MTIQSGLALCVRVLALAWAVTAAAAEPVTSIDLAGPWRFQPGDDVAWKEADFDDAHWAPIEVPGFWEESGYPQLDGFAWYRRHVAIPEAWMGQPLALSFAAISKADEVYVNGRLIGWTGGFPPVYRDATHSPRRYVVPADLIQDRKECVIAMRVFDGQQQLRGGIWKDGPRLSVAEPNEAYSVSVLSEAPGHLFTPDQPLALKIRVDSRTLTAIELALRVSLARYGGQVVAAREQILAVGPEAPGEFTLQLPPQPVGPYDMKVELHGAGGLIRTDVVALGVLPPAEPRRADPGSRFGVVAHLNRMSSQSLEQTVQLMARAGVRWAREGFLWDSIEPVEGQSNWDHYDRLVETCDRYGISVLPVLAYGTTWASNDPSDVPGPQRRMTAPRIDAWQHYVEAVVRRYGDRIRVWEVWNEPNSTTFFRPAPGASRADSYAQLLIAAYQTIKRVDPEAQVMIGGFTPKHWNADQPQLHEARFMEAIYQHGAGSAPFDILGYHPYTSPNTDTINDATAEKYLLLPAPCWDVMQRYGESDKPTWMTEMGTPTMPYMSGQRTADYLAVLYVTGLADPRIEKNFWYDFRDDGTDPDDKEHHFGLLRNDDTPKPTYFTYYTLTRLLEGATLVDRRDMDAAVVYRFRKAGQAVLVVWARENESAVISLRTEGRHARVLDVTGRPLDVQQSDDHLMLTISPSPVFVILRP